MQLLFSFCSFYLKISKKRIQTYKKKFDFIFTYLLVSNSNFSKFMVTNEQSNRLQIELHKKWKEIYQKCFLFSLWILRRKKYMKLKIFFCFRFLGFLQTFQFSHNNLDKLLTGRKKQQAKKFPFKLLLISELNFAFPLQKF